MGNLYEFAERLLESFDAEKMIEIVCHLSDAEITKLLAS